MNEIARLGFELDFNDIMISYVNHYDMEITLIHQFVNTMQKSSFMLMWAGV